MAIKFWDQVPGNSQLVVTFSIKPKKDGSPGPGTFAISGFKNDSDGNFQKLPEPPTATGPFTFDLLAGKAYQVAFEIAPAGGAEVICEAKVMKDGTEVRKNPWEPVKGSPSSRSVIIRTKKS